MSASGQLIARQSRKIINEKAGRRTKERARFLSEAGKMSAVEIAARADL
jgi:hypothetical protein